MIFTVKWIGILRCTSSASHMTVAGSLSKNLLPCNLRCKALSSSRSSSSDQGNVPAEKPTSKAMKAYLQRARDYEAFIEKEKLDFKIGKRHLANMMGEDPEEFTQDDVDRAIEYLFPSGLFEPKARPLMKPPEEVFPPQKAAEFDESGRPFSSFFYTGKSNFYKMLYDTVEHLYEVNDIEDKMIRKHLSPDPTKVLDLSGSEWISQEVLEHRFVEKLHTSDYKSFVSLFTRLANHPYSYHLSDHIMAYRKILMRRTTSAELPEASYDKDGRAYVTIERSKRKSASARVTVWDQGSGKITINGESLKYFRFIQEREQVIFPLIFCGVLGKADVEAHVEGGGTTGQAGAIRLGIALALRSFVDEDMRERMRIAGLLTTDRRTRERKKPGQEGARKKFTWKKR